MKNLSSSDVLKPYKLYLQDYISVLQKGTLLARGIFAVIQK